MTGCVYVHAFVYMYVPAYEYLMTKLCYTASFGPV